MSAERPIPVPPVGLNEAGRRVWDAIHRDVGADWELDARELLVLEAAARQADLNRALEDAIAADGVSVEGSQGQPRMNAMITEARQGRIAFEKLIGSLALPGDEGQTMTAAQKRATAAASARWLRAGRRGNRGAA